MDDFLKIFVQRIKEIPTLPGNAEHLLTLLQDDNVSLGTLEDAIGTDPAIAARVLSVANSVFFRSGQPVVTVNGALFRLGVTNVANIALGISLMTFFSGREGRRSPLDTRRIFHHSVAVGVIGQYLASRFRTAHPGEAFTVGLLHDLGLLVLNSYFGDIYGKVVELFRTGIPLLEAERRVLGTTHDVVGAWLADGWNLPEAVLTGIAYHHKPPPEESGLADLVHTADFIASNTLHSITDEDTFFPLLPSAVRLLDASNPDVITIDKVLDISLFSEALFRL